MAIEVRAKKHLGQHFLTDMNIARKITESLILPDVNPAVGGDMDATAAKCSGAPASEGDGAHGPDARSKTRSTEPPTVLEVGCGTGVLTQFLLEREARGELTLWGAEIDKESVAYLHEHYPAFSPRLIEVDFLRLDLAGMFPGGLRVIGNFPYNISSQIFFKVLDHRDLVPEVVGMIQKEVAVRIAEPPGSREYGILSVLLQAWYDIEYLFTVNENVFNPPPKVKSAVIRLRRNGVERLDCNEELFVKVVKAGFGQRRKMLRNALRAVFGGFAGREHSFFDRRAETLSVGEFVELTRWVEANRQ